MEQRHSHLTCVRTVKDVLGARISRRSVLNTRNECELVPSSKYIHVVYVTHLNRFVGFSYVSWSSVVVVRI